MVAPLEVRVPPSDYGGTELVVSLLTEELVRRGHEVTLFATADSRTSAHLVGAAPAPLRDSPHDRALFESLALYSAVARADQFDLIHNHNLLAALPMTALSNVPVLTTLHIPLVGDWPAMFARYRGWYNTISRSALNGVPPGGRYAGAVHNGIDPAEFPLFDGTREPYLLYFSRLSPEKGPHLAIEVARRLDRPLVLAGDLQPKDVAFFRREVEPHLDGERIRYLGRIAPAEKVPLLQRASCLLAPLLWDEPFGLFMIEAMSCGTPVVAFDRGSVREVIDPGRTGFIVRDVAAMATAAADADRLRPAACHAWVADRFSHRRMTSAYLGLYEQILAASSGATDRPPGDLVLRSPPAESGPAARSLDESWVPHVA